MLTRAADIRRTVMGPDHWDTKVSTKTPVGEACRVCDDAKGFW